MPPTNTVSYRVEPNSPYRSGASWDVLAAHHAAPLQTARAIEIAQNVAHDFQRLFRRAGIITRGA